MKKSKILLILIIPVLLLSGCKAKYTSKFQFSDLKYDDDYIIGHVKNITDNKYKLEISLELKNGGIKEDAKCNVNLNPKQTKKIKCLSYHNDDVTYEVKIKDVDFKQIPTFEEKNFKDDDKISEDDLKDYFEDAFYTHTMFNTSLLHGKTVGSYPYIKNTIYSNDKVQIFNMDTFEDTAFTSLEYYNKDGSFSSLYIEFSYTTQDEVDSFINNLSLSVSLIDSDLEYSDVTKYMKEPIEDDMCYKTHGYCISQHNGGVEGNKLKKIFYIEKQ